MNGKEVPWNLFQQHTEIYTQYQKQSQNLWLQMRANSQYAGLSLEDAYKQAQSIEEKLQA
ncbi:MAG: hypothetical protein H6765_11385 [Candidatus Peribacteria bacterium]|nr:MAG: hypothetical protein H6765_11385 [Candidatus Peribacteria bacterium]